MASPTERSLGWLVERGWEACVVEKFNSFSRKYTDAFGFGDILACHPQIKNILLVQTTTMSNRVERIQKILDNSAAKLWLESGGLINVHGWRKLKWQGWVVSVEPIQITDFGFTVLNNGSKLSPLSLGIRK